MGVEDDWAVDVQQAWSLLRAQLGLCYGPWRVREAKSGVVVRQQAGAEHEHYGHASPAYVVQDLAGTPIATVEVKELAELIAQIPDMCDPLLRPRNGAVGEVTMVSDVTGDEVPIPETPGAIGASTADYVWRVGYQTGFRTGEEHGYGVAVEDAEPEPLSPGVHPGGIVVPAETFLEILDSDKEAT